MVEKFLLPQIQLQIQPALVTSHKEPNNFIYKKYDNYYSINTQSHAAELLFLIKDTGK